MRIRVTMDIRKSLKIRMKIKEGEDWCWENFKYEKLPTFCFFCGIIGHSNKLRGKFFDYHDKKVEMFFGTWLRAPNRRHQNNNGDRWLRSSPPEHRQRTTIEEKITRPLIWSP